MCSEFINIMEQGDLTDMLRGYAGDWQFVSNPINYPSDPSQEFGDPFIQITDPLIHDNIQTPPNFMNVDQSNNSGTIFSATSTPSDIIKVFENHEEMKIRESNIFSRILQISPTAKLQVPARESPSVIMGMKSGPGNLVPNNNNNNINDQRYGLNITSPNSSKSCLGYENPAHGVVQISSPRNTGIKRRKGQAKKVVCIPAPAPANSRAGGEVVPSDLWAWRKYGQKPIKGSPYPRGYYRCSSSKGCSARKQVERSRTDPNMLVITYTSEHNHPWPTQRNALAGSTRTHQPSKTSSKNSQKQPDTKEEPKEPVNPIVDPSPMVMKQEKDKDFDMNDDDLGFQQSYKPVFLESSNPSEDNFFADLSEIEPDPLDLIFAQGFSGGDDPENKDLDPFTFYDWAGANENATTSSATANCEEAKKDS